MKSIIDKLNISVGKDGWDEHKCLMLEWLILDLIHQEHFDSINGSVDHTQPWIKEKYGESFANWLENQRKFQIEVIEKSLKKSWADIKILLESK